ncbi:MAG TPA: SBBP repeat-containing protein [Candidatus Sulfotelmatobacter sp.]|nr:SBBP repeat-containing protein [Candidatus Sulfotelmatobacter sp.]
MFKPSTQKEFVPAGIVIVATLVLAVLGVIGARRLGLHRPSVGVQHLSAAAPASAPQARARTLAGMASLPLAFEENQGQTDPQVKYVARGNGYAVFLTAHDAVFALHSSQPRAKSPAPTQAKQTAHDQTAAIRLHLIGGNPHSTISAASQLPGHSNYFIGNDRSRWHAGVPQFARVSYRDAYPGVNMTYYGLQKQLEFDFIVAPGASPDPIRLGVTGANRISTDEQGNLILASSVGNVLLHKPLAYQQNDGARRPVDARFVLQAHNQVSFELGNYDRNRELVIDPSVTYATYLGGTAEDDGNAIAVDGSGNAYITGQTQSNPFPGTTGGYVGGFDVFVTKISANGLTLDYSTYVGGTGNDSGNAIAVNASGDAIVAGGTGSNNFPFTAGVLQKTFGGGNFDAFLFGLSSNGSLVYSTFLGGTGDDIANGLALDGAGNTYVVGSTTSTNFPPSVNSISGMTAGGFAMELNSAASALVYSTYIGAGGNDFASAVAVDSAGNTYVTGATETPTFVTTPNAVQTKCGSDGNCNGGLYDAFVTVIKPTGSSLVYSTFLGGEAKDEGFGIAVDGAGDAYVTGFTQSTQFPSGVSRLQSTLKGSSDAFVSELNPNGSQLLNSTYLGGSGNESGLAITVDNQQNAYVTGVTSSSDFPTVNPTQPKNGGLNDAFVSEFNPGGASLLFSTYLGGSGGENTSNSGTTGGGGSLAGIAVDSNGANIYVTGTTTSPTGSFPATTGAYQTAFQGGASDAFVAKYANPVPDFSITNGALSPTSGTPGVSATATITVTSTKSFTGAVALTCSVAPVVAKEPTCSFSNNSVTPPANGTVTSTLNVATTGSSAMLKHPSDRQNPGIVYAMLLPIGAITLLGAGLGSAGSRRKRLFGFLMLGLLLSTLLLLPACSSSGGGGSGSGTPTGPYTITVTGTSTGTGGGTATGTPALTLTVN